MSANAARIELTPTEIEERKALFRRLDREFGSAKVIDYPSKKRQPLGLAPAGEPDEDKADDPTGGFKGFHFRDGEHKARPEDALRADWTFHYFDIIGGVMLSLHNDTVKEVNDLWRDVQRKIKESEAAQHAEQRVEVAELKVLVAELKAEVASLRAVQETQRVQSRGEQGVQGVRGVPGSQGPVGPAGPQGPRGDAAAMIVGWEPTPERFVLTPVLGDGTRGVSAHLLPFFEAYDASVRDNGDGEE